MVQALADVQRCVVMGGALMAHVMPTLTQGLVDVCKVRPADPVDYLAEYLFRNIASSPAT